MIDAIWQQIMTTRYERKIHLQCGVLAETALMKYEQRLALGARFKSYRSRDGEQRKSGDLEQEDEE